MLIRSLLIFFVAWFASCSDHESRLEDFHVRNASVDGKNYGFRVFVPKRRDPNEKLPVMLYLHGSGARGDDNVEPAYGFGDSLGSMMDELDFIVVLPQCRNESFWSSAEMSKYALAALDAAVNEFGGDRDRLYLAGYSLGAYGAWQIAAANPGKFAAIIPVAGGVVGERPIRPEDRAAIIPEVGTMLDSAEPYEAVATAIGRTPVWVFHGANDDAVPVDFSRTIVRALSDAGNDQVKYTEYENEGHFIVGRSFREPGFLQWLREQRLK